MIKITRFSIYLSLLLFLFANQAKATMIDLIGNGGFETGDFTSWSVTSNGTGGCDTDWNVSSVGGSSATGCQPGVFGGTFPSVPLEGAFAAYNSFDGNGPQEFRLSQSLVIPSLVNSATISWSETYNVDLTFGATVPREFTVELWDFTDTLLLGTIDSQTIGILGSQVEIDWTAFSSDITGILSAHTGESVTLAFTNVIPEAFTGPAGFGLDAVSLNVDTVPVPEPSTILLLGSGLIGLIGCNYRRRKPTT